MSNPKFVNIARLMTTYSFEIEQLADNLKCAKCKLVLKDACILSCNCTFCRICIDDMMSSGIEFCSGNSEECGESHLSCFQSDFRANNTISKLKVKCPNHGCVHECQLANMEEHLKQCPRKNMECPFRQLGCTQDNLATAEMNGHLLQENRGHSEILIGVVANINREIEILKQIGEDNRKEIDLLKQRDMDSREKIELLKQRDVDSKREIELLKHELVLKDGQIKTINDQMVHLENENKSISQGKGDLADRVKVLEEKIDRELNSAKASINQGPQSMKDDICSKKSQMELIEKSFGHVNAKFELMIVENLSKITWNTADTIKTSDIFTGVVNPYRYQLSIYNHGGSTGYLQIYLRIHFGPNDEKLAWPFDGLVLITVSDKDRRDVSKSVPRQCRISRPGNNSVKSSDEFKFLHSELISASLDISRGVRVSCLIVPGAGR